MAVYEVVFNAHEKFSSDVNVGTNPTPTTTVVSAVKLADVATVEAESPEDAETAVRVAYNASTSDVVVADVTPVAETEAEPEITVEPEVTEAEAAQAEDVEDITEPAA